MYISNQRNIFAQSSNTVQPKLNYNNGLNLTWENLNVVFEKNTLITKLLRKNNETKTILKNQYGQVSNGELVGLLGSR